MKTQRAAKKITVQKQTWFGPEAFIEIQAGIFHKAGLVPKRGLGPKVIIPHPPVINWLLRIGLNKDANDALSIAHEFGHLQTFPLAVIYFFLIFYLAISGETTNWLEVIFLLTGTHAAWEIMAEAFTIASTGKLYWLYYKPVSIMPRMIFWAVTVGLSVGGWVLLLFDS